ncbi:chemotaxis response regulator protein-glutamate methylesterase of group 2 operon [alpha proteobacterium Q-1]|nr:chemotaxis response regulator protein-glutamate methylesterase of group 2 operon [alpha proteobacterium Q-1]
MKDPFRVMVVDDSAVIRGFLVRYLEQDGAIKVVATASNGIMALRTMNTAKPEVVVLDIEMPEMDGMTALPKILEADPDVRVVMASTLTRKNAEISLRALQLGASDYVPKPETTRAVNANIDFRQELVEKVKVYGAARRRALRQEMPGGQTPGGVPSLREGAATTAPVRARSSYQVVARRGDEPASRPAMARPGRGAEPSAGALRTLRVGEREITLRAPSKSRPEILVIGSSTGGPQALIQVFTGIKDAVKHLPVLVVQHMPATFTAILADHLGRASGLPSSEAKDGEKLLPGHIYVAPGNHHMTMRRGEAGIVLGLDQNEPENFCRPSVDPMFRSVAGLYGARTLAVILTGMGHDGLRGARDLVGTGATLIAQDEASSVVWGMPGAVATAGLCSAVTPLSEIPDIIIKSLRGNP